MKHSFSEKIVSEILAWIEGNLNSNLSIADVADKAGYSSWHLQRVFKFHTGLSLGRYMRLRRISETMKALKFTSKSISDIADEFQFECISSYTRCFKEVSGMSPSQYRNGELMLVRSFLLPIQIMSLSKIDEPKIIKNEVKVINGMHASYNSGMDITADKYQQFSLDCIDKYQEKFVKAPRISAVCVDRDENKEAIVIHKLLGHEVSEGTSDTPIFLSSGVYAQFRYKGPKEYYFLFFQRALNYVLYKMNVHVSATYIIEQIVSVLVRKNQIKSVEVLIDIPLEV